MVFVESVAGHSFTDGVAAIMGGGITIDPIAPSEEQKVIELIKKNLRSFSEAGTVLASTFRRLERLHDIYQAPGSTFLVVRELDNPGEPIGSAGIGPMAALPPSEGIGEIREVVVDESYRGKGIGRTLLERCLVEARRFGYKRIYLEATPQMEKAQKLFLSFGFKPVQQKRSEEGKPVDDTGFPCYYLLDLSELKSNP